MSINEFMGFVMAVCNFHNTDLSRTYKEDCAVWWSNCAISEPERVDRRKLYSCLERAKKESALWGR